MLTGVPQIARPVNEPVKPYAPGCPERAAIEARLQSMLGEVEEIPVVVGGKRIETGRIHEVRCPHEHSHLLARAQLCGQAEIDVAAKAAESAWADWAALPWHERAAVFLRAAELLATTWRDTVNAATMLGQSKTVHQAEIDSACELVDFWRFNPHFMTSLLDQQPSSDAGIWNYVDWRPLEGFVLALSPFNFTSIGGNLATAPALMGNTVLWKPANTALLSNWYVFRVLEEAGLPPGVINFVPGHGPDVGTPALADSRLAGIHFTGSTATFQHLWRQVAANLEHYDSYPRIVGETGGKDFVFLHPSANAEAAATALVRGAFEYQGQKCSAASRAYVPASLWPRVSKLLREQVAAIEMGDPVDFRNFMAAVIDRPAYGRIVEYLEEAKGPGYEVLSGGGSDDSVGFFVEPTVVRSTDPRSRLMAEEIFGPVLTLFVYEDKDLDATVELVDSTSPYALTGAVFADDRQAIDRLSNDLRFAAGNFYINDKPTGAVVGQQPFGGARASGTNDKAGSPLNLLRWVSQRTIKETLAPPVDFRYPYMLEP
jgi:1-pyrroline-5-carboxylate dehydrogenase